ncbi:MAG: alcohol dehydrogenase catalytic domain-containing protein [Polaromonas sp.]|nr:alcohol dehydrogenase catalytic domain-containing protein [Polaromonas sp.]MDP2256135.1 alcohol dehydrogenase catalytic domain-containing protein [Polaromonas sp.]MDP3708972.1 alcohol dehydrogenase catalytic domain-containing protein [Polaromonas sp.]
MTVDPSGRTLRGAARPVPLAAEHDVVVHVLACGVCRTDLHIIDGDLPPGQPGARTRGGGASDCLRIPGNALCHGPARRHSLAGPNLR